MNMKKLILIALLGIIPAAKADGGIIFALVAGGVAVFEGFKRYANYATKELSTQEFNKSKDDIARFNNEVDALNNRYKREMGLINQHQETEEFLEQMEEVIKNPLNIYLENVNYNADKAAQLQHESSAAAQAWQDKEGYKELTQAAQEASPKFEVIKNKLRNWKNALNKERSYLELRQLNSQFEREYKDELELHHKYDKDSKKYQEQLLSIERQKGSQDLFPLIRAINDLNPDVRNLENKLEDCRIQKGFFDFLRRKAAYNRGEVIKLALKRAHDTIAASSELQQQKVDAERVAIERKHAQAAHDQAAAAKENAIAQKIAEENRKTELNKEKINLELERSGHWQLKRDYQSLINQNHNLKFDLAQSAITIAVLTNSNKNLQQVVNNTLEAIKHTRQFVCFPPFNPEYNLNGYKQEINKYLQKVEETLTK